MNRTSCKQIMQAIAAVVTAVPMLTQADDITWVGTTPGSTDQMVNWSSGSVPGPFDKAVFAGAGGSVSLNGGTWSPGRIDITPNSDHWTFHNGVLETYQFDNRGASAGTFLSSNRIAADVTIRGADYYGFGTYFVASSDYQTRIDGAIVDGDNPTEVHLRAKLTGESTYTGRTQAWNSGDGLEILGSAGRIAASTQIDVFAANLVLDSTTDINDNTIDDDFNTDRLPDSSNVRLQYGNLTLRGRNEDTLSETIGSLTIGRGKNYINIDPVDYDPIHETRLHLSNGTAGLTRADRGTGQLNTRFFETLLGDAAKITMQNDAQGVAPSGAIPYLVAFGQLDAPSTYFPVVYDKGDDESFGSSDDVGLRPLKFFELTSITTAPSMTHALAQGTSTLLSTSTVCSTLTCIDDGITGAGTLTLNAPLTVLEGQLVLNSGANIAGASTLNLGTTEGIVHVPGYNTSTISAPLVTTNLTKGGDGTLHLSNSANQITGQTIINGGRLILANPTAGGTAPIQLQEADLTLEFSSGTFANTTYWESGANGPFGGFAWITELRVPDNATVTMTGRFEGPGALALHGDGAKLVLTNTSPNVTSTSPFFLIGSNTTVELNGIFGNSSMPGGGGYFWTDPNSRLMGVGTADCSIAVNPGARITPGSTASPVGRMSFRYINLQPGGTLEFQNGATGARGVDYDAIDCVDGAELYGSIRMVSEGVVQAVGAIWEVLHLGPAQNGNPTITTDTPLAGGKQYVKIFYPDKLVIGVAGYTGDANLDGRVNTVDFNALAGNFGVSSANWLMGDFDYDRLVTSMDFDLLAGNYGKKITGLGPTLGSQVPEPTGMVALATMSILLRRTRRG